MATVFRPWLIRCIAVVGAAVCIAPAHADDTQGWLAGFVSGPVAKDSRVLVWFDGHARYRDDAADLDVTILRPGVGWRVGNGLDLWVGYARVTTERPGPNVEEDRAWQQATYPVTEWFGGRLTGRTRLEQRFRDAGSDTGWRLRQFFRYARPLGPESPFGLLLANEVFVSFNDADWGQRSGFDQNRALAGGYYQPHPRFRLEAGYMHQYIRGPGAAPDRTNHNVSLAFFVPL